MNINKTEYLYYKNLASFKIIRIKGAHFILQLVSSYL